MADRGEWSQETSGKTLPPVEPPPDTELPTYADRTHTVSASATGGGTGTDGSPWTLAEACLNAQPGMIIGVRAGVYVGTNEDREVYTPAFYPRASGTAQAPIVFVAEHWAARPSVSPLNYSDIRTGRSGPTKGGSAFGSYNGNYVKWIGFYSNANDPTNVISLDAAYASLRSCQYSEIHYCRIVGNPATVNNGRDNYSGVRVESADYCVTNNNDISGFNGYVNYSGMISYKNWDWTAHHNHIYNCQNGFQLKGGYRQGERSKFGGFLRWDCAYNDIHDCKTVLRFHSVVALEEADYYHVYCNKLHAIGDIGIEFTSSNTGNFYGLSDDPAPDGPKYSWAVMFGIQFYNNVLDYPKNFSTIGFTVAIFGSTMDNETTIDRNCNWSNNIYMPGASKHVIWEIPFATPTGAHALRIFNGSNRNIYTRRGNFISFNDGGYSFAEAAAAGQEVDSITANPLLDADYRPQTGSPAIGFGRDVFGRFGPVNGVVDAGCYPTGTEVIGVID